MGLEIVLFISAILFGIFLYWRESNGNGAYRVLNKMVNSKELQMKPDSRKGFIYGRSFLPRFIFVVAIFLITAIVIEFLTPLQVLVNYQGLSMLCSVIFGTLVGTYVANFVLKSSQVLEDQSDSFEDKFDNALEKGKEFINDIKNKDNKAVAEAKEEIEPEPQAESDKKSARERLKDKGLM